MYRKLRLSNMCVLSSLCFSAFLYVRVHFPQCVFQISINSHNQRIAIGHCTSRIRPVACPVPDSIAVPVSYSLLHAGDLPLHSITIPSSSENRFIRCTYIHCTHLRIV